MNIKDMVYALFGNYANSATTKLTSQKDFLANSANDIKYVPGTSKSLKTIQGQKAIAKLAEKQVKVFKAAFGARSEIFEAIDVVKYLDISQQVIETIVNDAFYSFDAEEPFTVKYVGNIYDSDEVNDRIQRTIQRLKLYQVFRDMADDLVTYGEYYLETPCKQGLGIVEINDTVFVHDVISVYDNYELLYHIAERKTSYGTTEIVQVDKDNLSHFIVDTKRIRTRSGKFDDITGVPEIVKVGRSILLPVLKLLQRYNLLDIAGVAQDIRSTLMPTLIRLGVTDQTTPEQMMESVKRYEEYFLEMGDALHSLDASKELSTAQILQLATQVKIIPASDRSGSLEKQAFNSEYNLNESQDRLAARIKSTVGIPTDEEAKTRINALKEKARYSKKLLDIQYGAAKSFIALLLKDLRYQGIIVDEANIELKFKAIQNPNVEEDAEGMFHIATSARDIIRTYVETAEDIQGLKLNPAAAKKFLDSLMSPFPYCADMLETDMFDTLNPEENPDEFGDDSDIENAGFVENDDFDSGSDGTENGPESIGSEPEEPLIEPEEPTEEPTEGDEI